MPFGLYNAPATFQSMMDNGVIVYFDSILIYTENVDKYIPPVQEVLSRLDKASLRVNLKKSSFHIRKVEFLAYIISEQGIEMFEMKIEEVKNWAVLRKVKDVQEFLRLTNFY